MFTVVTKDGDKTAHDSVCVTFVLLADGLLPEGDGSGELDARIGGGRTDVALVHALDLFLPVVDACVPEGSGESLLEKRIDAAFEKTAQPQKTRPFGHVEESFDGNVDGHPGEVAEGPAVGRHDGRNAGGKFRGTRPCAERIKSDARFGKDGMEFERSGTTRDLGRLPDGVAKTLAALGVDDDDGFPPKDRLGDEAREHHALPCLSRADDERAAAETRERTHDVVLFGRTDPMNDGTSDVPGPERVR